MGKSSAMDVGVAVGERVSAPAAETSDGVKVGEGKGAGVNVAVNVARRVGAATTMRVRVGV